MELVFQLQDLLQQGDSAIEAASRLLGHNMALLDCLGVETLTPGQMELLFTEIPQDWDFWKFSELIVGGSLSNSLAHQINEYISQQSSQASSEVMSDEEALTEVSIEGIDKAIAFLPTLKKKHAKLFDVHPHQSRLDPCTYSNEVAGFIQTLYDEGFILSTFDWGMWLDTANEFVNHSELIEVADLLTLQKLLTTHIRAERFNSGHVAQLIENGHISKVLQRLAALRESMAATTATIKGISRITIVQGDITQQHTDAIVNTTNIALEIRGEVSEAIFAVAGPSFREECRKLKGCAVGQAKVTRGYNLSAAWVLHTVSPVWQGGSHHEEDLLAQCYRHCLELAELCPIQTIAFPCIGTGSHGFPVEKAAQIAAHEVQHFLEENTSLDKVVFVCRDITMFDIYSKAIKEMTKASPEQTFGTLEPVQKLNR
jgi:O-acetyl-ADP-ribose deacetylase (regulator of RNase III)